MSKLARSITLLALTIAIVPIFACGEKPPATDASSAPAAGAPQSAAPTAPGATRTKAGPVGAPRP